MLTHSVCWFAPANNHAFHNFSCLQLRKSVVFLVDLTELYENVDPTVLNLWYVTISESIDYPGSVMWHHRLSLDRVFNSVRFPSSGHTTESIFLQPRLEAINSLITQNNLSYCFLFHVDVPAYIPDCKWHHFPFPFCVVIVSSLRIFIWQATLTDL